MPDGWSATLTLGLLQVSAYWHALLRALAGQCNGLCCFDVPTDLLQERLGSFLTADIARRNTQRLLRQEQSAIALPLIAALRGDWPEAGHAIDRIRETPGGAAAVGWRPNR